ncbi:hypothetical protein BST13_33740 [Mycobacterium aquaticum]|uniref:Uncharacterized protein n=2 Tax=Mycobacterium aquaticum TaxID=1927124 RepID=A0A1X0A4D2_9MYCO|nr:hypothetical protein BST13_33740 [Mycobacterium aquaticum]
MTEYQRNRQAEQPRGAVKVHAHLHGLTLNDAVYLYEAGAFEGIPCAVTGCGQAIEWSGEVDEWQHHATKLVRCAGNRGVATPPDWYVGDPVLDEAFEDLTADDGLAQDLAEATPFEEREQIGEAIARESAEAHAAHRRRPPRVDGDPYDTEFARGIMAGLQHKPIYQGTVQTDEIERRRLRNRDANRARRAMRRARVKRSRARFAHNRSAAA